jgi:hypothetical protein
MRIPLLLVSILFCLCACENKITDIGKRFEDNTRFVEVKRFEIENSSTIRLDSFPTSAIRSLANDTVMVVGKMEDRTTGTITSSPYFEVHLTDLRDIDFSEEFVYDSLTLVMRDTKVIAGDTTAHQILYLHRLSEVPRFNVQLPYYTNTDTVPLGDRVSTLRLLPQVGHLTYTYFKLDDQWGRELYNLAVRQDQILFSSWAFLYYLKGFAIIPDENNSTLFSVRSTFELRCYYHHSSNAQTAQYVTFASRPLSTANSDLALFTFSNHKHVPKPDLANASMRTPMPFIGHNYAVIQGLNGYMLKLEVPYIQENSSYRTIVKAQIAIKPRLENFEPIPEPKRLYLYECDELGVPKKEIIAEGYSDPTMLPENKRFVFDITDYYRDLVQGATDKNYVQVPTMRKNITLLVGLPGFVVPIVDEQRLISGNVNTSFERMIIRDIPELFIHYIQFK